MHVKSHRLIVFFLTLLSVLSILPAAAQSGDCLPTQFSADDYYPMAIVTPGDSNNVRAEPSPSGELLGQIAAGKGMIIEREDPVCANGYLWRRVSTPYIRGWTVEASADAYFIVPYVERDPVVAVEREAGSDTVVESHGVTFTIPAALPFIQVTSEIIPFSLYRQTEYPSALGFVLYRYDDEPLYIVARITIYNLGASRDYIYDADWLETTLTDQPPLADAIREYGGAPQMPIGGARALFTGVPTYIPFGSGNGLRYVTAFAQDSILFTPDTPYTVVYRGITSDSAYLIAIQLPAQLPSGAIPAAPTGRQENAYTDYLRAFEANLAPLPSSAFTPDLALYDALFSSIRITDADALNAALP